MKTKLFILLLMAIFGSSTYSQSITNTLGSTGNFIIKDVSNTFFTLDQATGFVTLNNSMSLPNTTSSTIGVIYKGSTRFIHNYYGTGTPGGNTFVGAAAGNFTMSGSGDATSYNSGFGASSLQSNTTGQKNSAFGVQTLRLNQDGYENAAFGFNALYSNTSGYHNSAFGVSALTGSESGYNNSAFGYYAGNSVSSGSNLTLIGYNAQPSAGTATNEMTFGS
ncbi:MAG: hypothetical protein Q8Q47_01365, partial [Ignavibacteriaceae bacterium]|nr:hypothetical protein [Ignavibacteriaceae bacterium]